MTVEAVAASAGEQQQEQPRRPLRLAVHNQVNFHLHVAAGAMRALSALSSTPVAVFLTKKVLHENWYGFMDWLGGEPGFEWRDVEEFEAAAAEFDLVWFMSPEYDIPGITRAVHSMRPDALRLLYMHNGHMPQEDFDRLSALSPDLPLLGMAPHVASYLQQRLQQAAVAEAAAGAQGGAAAAAAAGARHAEWVLPVWPYKQPPRASSSGGLEQDQLLGFSIVGSLDTTLRGYDKVWQAVGAYRQQHGAAALATFRLNILGEVLGEFKVPDDLQQYVQLYKTPPDPVFYDVIYHSYGIWPALANPAYYTCKLTSAAITTLMTGVPIIADEAFLAAYSMLSRDTVFPQAPGESELDVMFRVARLPPEQVWRTRRALLQLQGEMNARCVGLLAGWLRARGLEPEGAGGKGCSRAPEAAAGPVAAV